MFVRIRWSGSSRASSSSSSYFRRVPIDDTSRARAPRDAFASLDSLDFHETFVHTRCDMIRAGDARERSGATVAVADLARLDDLAHLDDPARVDEGNPVFSRGRCACPSARSPTTPNPARRAGNYARGSRPRAFRASPPRRRRRPRDRPAHGRRPRVPGRPRATLLRFVPIRGVERRVRARRHRDERDGKYPHVHDDRHVDPSDPSSTLDAASRGRDGTRAVEDVFHVVVASRRLGFGFGVFAP